MELHLCPFLNSIVLNYAWYFINRMEICYEDK